MRCADSKEQQIAIAAKLNIIDNHDRRAFFSSLVAEAREVVAPGERPSRLAHSRFVQLVFHPPHKPLCERRSPRRDLIEVVAGHRFPSRVEPSARLFNSQNVDVGRQSVIQRMMQLDALLAPVGTQANNLPERVHSRVGAPGARDLNRL